MSKRPQSVVKLLLGQDRQLNQLIYQAKILAQTKIIINQVVDYQIAEHTEVARLQNGQLTLICDSAVWATRLRYMEPQIIKKLSEFAITKNLSRIEIKIRPSSFSAQHPEKPKRQVRLTQAAADQMLQDSDSISDPKLQDAIKKLARHAKN